MRNIPAIKTIYLILGCCLSILTISPAKEELPADPRDIFGIWWRGGQNPAEFKKNHPYVKGVFTSFYWDQLEPQPEKYDWKYFEDKLTGYTEAGFYMQLIVMVGPASPRWIYDHGVPEVETTPTINPWGEPHGWTYPYYLDEDYKRYYHRIIRKVAERIDTLPSQVREKIICIQTAEGTTGDTGPYKGTPLDKQYEMPEEEWLAFKFRTWLLFDKLYGAKEPKIHLLINSGQRKGIYHDWIMEHMPDTWRKAGNPGHAYQLNNEEFTFKFLDPFINHRNRQGNFIRCRSEMDELHKGWFAEAPIWNHYWLNLWNLQFGMDILQFKSRAFADPRNDEGFIFFSKYAGQKDPSESPGAWCALKDGLDAEDRKRFTDAEFGAGKRVVDEGMQYGIDRCLAIAKAFEARGARQGDPGKGMLTSMKGRDADALNDVAWSIWEGNYERYLTQIDPSETSHGWWRVGSKDQPYGRFARGFDKGSGRTAMYFDLDDRFFSKAPAAPHEVSVRVVYFDEGRGSWELRYDAVGASEKTVITITNQDSGAWKEVVLELTDTRFENNGPRGADLWLAHIAGDNTLFHMVEVMRPD